MAATHVISPSCIQGMMVGLSSQLGLVAALMMKLTPVNALVNEIAFS
jgi:hypothetical protein